MTGPLKALMSNKKEKGGDKIQSSVYDKSTKKKQHRQESLRKTRRHSGTLSYIRPLGEVCTVADCVLTVCVRELTLRTT